MSGSGSWARARTALGGWLRTLLSLAAYAGMMVPIAAVDFAILHLLVRTGVWLGLGEHYLLANVVSFSVANLLTWVCSRRWIFKPAASARAVDLVTFTVIGVVALGLQSVVMYLAVTAAGIDYRLGKLASMVLTVIWTYFARRWLFARSTRLAPAPATDAQAADAQAAAD